METTQFGTNFVTEYNLSSIVNKLLPSSKNGFIITDVEAYPDTSAPFEFNIGGYYVSTTIDDILEALNNASEVVGGSDYYQNFVTFNVDDNYTVKAQIAVTKSVGGASGAESTPIEESYYYLDGRDYNDNSEAQTSGSTVDEVILPLFTVFGSAGSYTFDSFCMKSRLRFTNLVIDGGVIQQN